MTNDQYRAALRVLSDRQMIQVLAAALRDLKPKPDSATAVLIEVAKLRQEAEEDKGKDHLRSRSSYNDLGEGPSLLEID